MDAEGKSIGQLMRRHNLKPKNSNFEIKSTLAIARVLKQL